HVAGLAGRAERADAGDDPEPCGDAMVRQPAEVASGDLRLEAELGLREAGAGGDLRLEPGRGEVVRRVERGVGAADEEVWRGADLAAGGQRPGLPHVAGQRHHTARIEVVNRLRLR